MSTYEDIFGKRVKFFDDDPTLTSSYEGQVWYNSADGVLKSVIAISAWASTSSLATARESAGGAGIQTAAMVFGGRNEVSGPATGGPDQQYNLNEEYNGTSYSTGGALVQGRQSLSGAGTQTAGLGVGGYHPPSPGVKSLVEEYDGSSWSEVTNMPTATFGQGSAGTQTAAVVFGGRTPSWVTSTFEYDGTNWTSGGALGTARTFKGAATGTQTAALAVGGDQNPPSGATNKVEEYDGSSFSEVNTYPTNIQTNAVSGIQTSALSFGGNVPPATTATNTYDGTSFTATGSLGAVISGQNTLKTAPNNSTGLSMGGYGASSYVGTSEEFTSSINTITAAAYSSVPNLNNGRDVEGFGSKNGTTTAAYAGNGGVPPNGMSNYTEEFDGSSWTAGGNLPGSWRHSGGTGIQTAGLCVGGFNGPSNLNGVYHYNGSSWSGGGNYPVAQYAVSVAGTQTAAIGMGGGSDTTPANTYNGSSWTSAGTMSVGRSWFGSAGTTTAALAIGGSNATTGQCEEYDGSSWTSGGSLVTGRTMVTTCSFGTQTAAGQSGANTPTNPSPGKINFLQTYDGTSWLTGATLGTGRQNSSGSGTTTSHLVATGFGPGTTYSVAAEEYTPGSSVATSKTLTTS